MEEHSIFSEFYKMDNHTPFEIFGDIHLITLGIILSVSLIFSFTAKKYYNEKEYVINIIDSYYLNLETCTSLDELIDMEKN